MVATQGWDLRGEDFLSSSPFFVHVWIVDSTVVWPVDSLEGRLAPRWLNN